MGDVPNIHQLQRHSRAIIPFAIFEGWDLPKRKLMIIISRISLALIDQQVTKVANDSSNVLAVPLKAYIDECPTSVHLSLAPASATVRVCRLDSLVP